MTGSTTPDQHRQEDETRDPAPVWYFDTDRHPDMGWVHHSDWNDVRDSEDAPNWHDADWRGHLETVDLSKLWELGLSWVHHHLMDRHREDAHHEQHQDDQHGQDGGHASWITYGDYHVVWDHNRGDRVVLARGSEPEVRYDDGWIVVTDAGDGYETTLRLWDDGVSRDGDWDAIA